MTPRHTGLPLLINGWSDDCLSIPIGKLHARGDGSGKAYLCHGNVTMNQGLELKVPPGVLMLIIAVLMWGATLVVPSIALPTVIRLVLALALFVVGAAFGLAGIVSFRRARTTVNPMRPSTTSSLVSMGVYSLTRNPMYLGILLILLGWAVFLANALALVGGLVFVLYMNRFQIVPEERALAARFGPEFLAYKARVRRWI